MKKYLTGLGTLVVLLGLYLLFWPVPIDPDAWTPMPGPDLKGIYDPNRHLDKVQLIPIGDGSGPEDVAVDRQGRVYAGLRDGRIIRISTDDSQPETFADVETRVLGLHFDARDNLIVCANDKGLLSIAPDGTVTVLSTEQGGRPFRFVDDVDIAQDGTIYFSDASFKFSFKNTLDDLMEHRPNGRLLAYDPKTKATRMLLDKLYFANGVAVSPDQTFVLVNETGAYRTMRYWLQGERKGQAEIFIDNLPGFPDGVSAGGKETFWLALVSPRKTDVDSLLMPRPYLRKVLMRLPEAIRPKAENYAFVLGLDREGNVTHNLQGPDATIVQISSVQEHEGMLYLGSLVGSAIGRLPAPP